MHRVETWGELVYDVETDLVSAVSVKAKPRLIAPIGVGWLVIGQCDKVCGHCYGNIEELPRHFLNTENCLKVAEKLADSGVLRVVIAGGEPMLQPDVSILASYLRARGVGTILGTNGSRLNSSTVQVLNNFDWVEISLDSHLEAINNFLRPSRSENGNSFVETISAIQHALNFKSRVRVLTSVSNHNENDLFELAKLISALGVQHWSISSWVYAGRAKNNFELTRQNDNYVQKTIQVIRTSFPNLKIKYSNRKSQGKIYCLVYPNGHIGTEDQTSGNKIFYGSLLMETVKDNWTDVNYDQQSHFAKWVGDRVQNERKTA